MTAAEMDETGKYVAQFRKDYAGTLYAVRAGDFIKIGFTRRHISERMAKLQTGCPLPLQLIATGPGGRFMEIRIHEILRGFRVHGEWFQDHPTVLELVERFCTTRH